MVTPCARFVPILRLSYLGSLRTLRLQATKVKVVPMCGCDDLPAQVGHGGGSEQVVNPATPPSLSGGRYAHVHTRCPLAFIAASSWLANAVGCRRLHGDDRHHADGVRHAGI